MDFGDMNQEMNFEENTVRDVTDQGKLRAFIAKKTKVPLELLNKRQRIGKIEQDSVLATRLYCPASYRPYDGYLISSNGVFELARIERVVGCSMTLF